MTGDLGMKRDLQLEKNLNLRDNGFVLKLALLAKGRWRGSRALRSKVKFRVMVSF